MSVRPFYEYLSHMADDGDPKSTLCGLPWQAWQVPAGLPKDVPVMAPVRQPRPHRDQILLCEACRRVAMR